MHERERTGQAVYNMAAMLLGEEAREVADRVGDPFNHDENMQAFRAAAVARVKRKIDNHEEMRARVSAAFAMLQRGIHENQDRDKVIGSAMAVLLGAAE